MPSNIISTETMRLNAICPYFTMFPLVFPLDVLKAHAKTNSRVLDPFCGRGTTNFAARLVGLQTAGIDASRVAVAATQAKLVSPTPQEIVDAARDVLKRSRASVVIPDGRFWQLAYHDDVLHDLCQIRSALMDDLLPKPIATALRGIILGGLHGPIGRTRKSYFSNQSPRTYGPKPAYAVKFWTERDLMPPRVSVIEIIQMRAQRYYGTKSSNVKSITIEGDSRKKETVGNAYDSIGKFDWIITSPPYYGLRTYLPDQWIRNWFLGGPPVVDYSFDGQISHRSRDKFIADLRKVWINIGQQCNPYATLVVRFGSIRDRMIENPEQLITTSLESTGWIKKIVNNANNAAHGNRQADTFCKNRNIPCDEVDVWAHWEP